MIIAVQGRIRFLSHLETQETLLGALRRAGLMLALSQGMKPKPVIKLALPRPVAVASWGEIVEVRVQDEFDPDDVAMRLVGTLPDGLEIVRVERVPEGEPDAASRVIGATYRAQLEDGVTIDELREAVERFEAADQVLVERSTPKQRRTVDVRSFADVTVLEADDGPWLRWHAALRSDGSVKPAEVITAIAGLVGRDLRTTSVIRESIAVSEVGGGIQDVMPAMVGADVPDGPEKPWGAC